jgi:uncharacterized cupredoxin-like copper-binding protein
VKRLARVVVAVVAAVATVFAGYAVNGTTHADAATALGPGLVTVKVDVHYSAFSISELHVRPGTLVRFLVQNNDPIDHEFIVGDASVHAAHQHGHERVHPPVPGEVSVAPGQLGETFYEFDRPGRYLFACHFPGHLAFGMKGWVIVDPGS